MEPKGRFQTATRALLLVALLCSSSARAQVTIDVEQITCEQFVQFRVADPNEIGTWLSGYFHGKHGDKLFYVQEFKKNLADLKAACVAPENAGVPVMQVAEKLFPRK